MALQVGRRLGRDVRFVAACDEDYEPIRQMAREGDRVAWP